MKSQKVSSHHQDAEDEVYADSQAQEDSFKSEPTLPKPVRTASGLDATFLMLMGIGCVVGGLALSLGPKMSWKMSQIATGFKNLGIEGGVVIMGGMVLTALAILRRGQIALRAPTPEQAEDRVLIEQLTKESLRLTEDISRVESGLAHVEAELASSREIVEDCVHLSTQQVIAAIAAPKEGGSSEEAIFRLAASLDQVGMRIDQRLKTQYTALQDHLEDVGAAILSARNHVQGLQRSGEEHAAAFRDEVQSHVESVLEETGFWSNGRGNKPASSLGVLDTIEDGGALTDGRLGAINAALPVNPEAAHSQGEAGQPSSRPEGLDTKTRLLQLSTLLADPELRRALEGMRNSNQ